MEKRPQTQQEEAENKVPSAARRSVGFYRSGAGVEDPGAAGVTERAGLAAEFA